MSVVSRFFNNNTVQLVLCYGALPLVIGGVAAAINHEKLDAPARTADYNAAQKSATEIGTFLTKAQPRDQLLLEAFNTRKAYLGARAEAKVTECVIKNMPVDGKNLEIAQTEPNDRMTSYLPPILSDSLANPKGTLVAVVPVSPVALKTCAKNVQQEFASVPTAQGAKDAFYGLVIKGLLMGGVAGIFVRARINVSNRRENEAKPEVA